MFMSAMSRTCGTPATGYPHSMSTDPIPNADHADVDEQERLANPADPAGADDPVPGSREGEALPDEADEGDVVEQHTDVPGWGDDEDATE